MKILASVLFAVFFACHFVGAMADTVHCDAGKYLPVQRTSCEDCPDACPAGTTVSPPNTLTPCYICVSTDDNECNNGNRGFYCPGTEEVTVPRSTRLGLELCPGGFPTASDKTDGDKCSVKFFFFPGKEANFRGNYVEDDNTPIEALMYWQTDSDVFDYGGSGKHYLKAKYNKGGANAPAKAGYAFSYWEWKKDDSSDWIQVTSTVDIQSGSSRKIRAKWKYSVVYRVTHDDGMTDTIPYQDAVSGETYTVLPNSTLRKATDSTKHLFANLIPEGKVFDGWCVGSEVCDSSNLVRVEDTICDECDNATYIGVQPDESGKVYLYAEFRECGDNLVAIPDDDGGKCVCKQGYYGTEENCQKCPDGVTTLEPDVEHSDVTTGTENDVCKYTLFQYKVGDENKTWHWPDNISAGVLTNIKPYSP